MANLCFLHNIWKNHVTKPKINWRKYLSSSPHKLTKIGVALHLRTGSVVLMGLYGNRTTILRDQVFTTIIRWFSANAIQRRYVPRSSEITALPHISEYFYCVHSACCSNSSPRAMYLVRPKQRCLLHAVILHAKSSCQKGGSWARPPLH